MATIILQPNNQQQADILVALAKEMKISFTTVEPTQGNPFLCKLTAAAKDAKLIATGKKKGKPVTDLLK